LDETKALSLASSLYPSLELYGGVEITSGRAAPVPYRFGMEARNGKWVNVDYSQRVLDDHDAASSNGHGSDALRRTASLRRSNSGRNAPDGDEYYIHITVSEPVKQGEGMNSYISYKIGTNTNRPQFTKSSISVIRRYSDFVWLHGNLSSMYPGVVVPPLPEKLLVGRFSPEFIESRRRALQVFLHRCSLHPELQHSEHLTTFLEASDEALAAFKADPRHAGLKGARGTLFQWLDDTVATISTTLGAATSVQLEKTSADIEVDEMMNYIDGLEPIMTGLHKHANGLTKRAREIADGLFEFGVAYSLLGKSEDNPSLQEGLREIAHCADRLSLLAAEFAEKEALHFEAPILDYIRLVGAVKAALYKRNEVRGSYALAVADLDAKNAIVQKLVKHKSTSDDKFQVAESDVLKAQQRVDDAKLEFDIVTERVMREVERFKREKLADFKRIVLDYVQMQIAYSKKVGSACRENSVYRGYGRLMRSLWVGRIIGGGRMEPSDPQACSDPH
jgi:sorting nexin-1/2